MVRASSEEHEVFACDCDGTDHQFQRMSSGEQAEREMWAVVAHANQLVLPLAHQEESVDQTPGDQQRGKAEPRERCVCGVKPRGQCTVSGGGGGGE